MCKYNLASSFNFCFNFFFFLGNNVKILKEVNGQDVYEKRYETNLITNVL